MARNKVSGGFCLLSLRPFNDAVLLQTQSFSPFRKRSATTDLDTSSDANRVSLQLFFYSNLGTENDRWRLNPENAADGPADRSYFPVWQLV